MLLISMDIAKAGSFFAFTYECFHVWLQHSFPLATQMYFNKLDGFGTIYHFVLHFNIIFILKCQNPLNRIIAEYNWQLLTLPKYCYLWYWFCFSLEACAGRFHTL